MGIKEIFCLNRQDTARKEGRRSASRRAEAPSQGLLAQHLRLLERKVRINSGKKDFFFFNILLTGGHEESLFGPRWRSTLANGAALEAPVPGWERQGPHSDRLVPEGAGRWERLCHAAPEQETRRQVTCTHSLGPLGMGVGQVRMRPHPPESLRGARTATVSAPLYRMARATCSADYRH